MKAIDTWKCDDPVLSHIHIIAYFLINAMVIIIFGFVLGTGLRGVWFAQIAQDLWLIISYQGLYLCEDDIPRPFKQIKVQETPRKQYNSPSKVKHIQSYGSPEKPSIGKFKYGYGDESRSHETQVKVQPYAVSWETYSQILVDNLKK